MCFRASRALKGLQRPGHDTGDWAASFRLHVRTLGQVVRQRRPLGWHNACQVSTELNLSLPSSFLFLRKSGSHIKPGLAKWDQTLADECQAAEVEPVPGKVCWERGKAWEFHTSSVLCACAVCCTYMCCTTAPAVCFTPAGDLSPSTQLCINIKMAQATEQGSTALNINYLFMLSMLWNEIRLIFSLAEIATHQCIILQQDIRHVWLQTKKMQFVKIWWKVKCTFLHKICTWV